MNITMNIKGINLILIFPMFVLMMILSGCEAPSNSGPSSSTSASAAQSGSQNSSQSASGSISTSTPTSNSTNPSTGISNVCDPFTKDPSHAGADPYHGIAGSLDYLPSNVSLKNLGPIGTVAAFQKYEIPVSAPVFLSEMSAKGVPFGPFGGILGFETQAGGYLLNNDGQNIYKDFELHLASQLQLTAADKPGLYQFEVRTDGDALLQIESGPGFSATININEETEREKDNLEVARTISEGFVNFENEKSVIPLKLDYYHLGRKKVTLDLKWRRLTVSDLIIDLLGPEASDLVKADKTEWQVVPAANFLLPTSVAENPCNITAPVTTTITQETPSEASTLTTSISFSFTSNYSSATFNCSLDGSVLASCQSPQNYSNLAVGNHQFKVFATVNGQSDPVGAVYTWSITAPISTSILSSVPAQTVTNSTSISISFTSNYSNASFTCSLDGSTPVVCTSPQSYSGLANGTHEFIAYSSANGQTDTVGANYNWTINTIPPQVLSNSNSETSSSFTINWTTNEPTTSFVQYGAGPTVNQSWPTDPTLVTNHTVTVTGLAASTIYSYTFGGTDQAGNTTSSGPYRLRTSQ